MNFIEDLQRLSAQINERKNHIINEETTKQSLIIPFIQLLGYDVFDPQEVRPEFVSDFAKKKGEKVDYAIFKDNKAIIFVEAKAINENLEKHSAQIARYFNATHTMRLAVLTNGIDYQLYTDLNVINVMDESPFLRFNILSPSEDSLTVINWLRREHFDHRTIRELAEELVYAKDIELFLRRQLTDPSSDFIRFIIKDMIDGRITSTVVEKFRPLIEKSLLKTVQSLTDNKASQEELCSSDSVQKRPVVRKTTDKPVAESGCPAIKEPEVASLPPVTVASEPLTEPSDFLRSIFDTVAKVVEVEQFEPEKLRYKNTSSEMTIYSGLPDNWIAKIHLVADKHLITLPLNDDAVAKKLGNLFVYEGTAPEETTIAIDHPDDVFKLARLIVRVLNQLTVEA